MKILQVAINDYFDGIANKAPKCFTKKEFKSWILHEEFAHTEPRKFPCRDCTAAFQHEMKLVGRCHIPTVPVEKIAK